MCKYFLEYNSNVQRIQRLNYVLIRNVETKVKALSVDHIVINQIGPSTQNLNILSEQDMLFLLTLHQRFPYWPFP